MCAALLAGCNSGDDLGGKGRIPKDGDFDPAQTKIAICMSSINHPVHRIAQAGFVIKGEEFGFQAGIVGLDESSIKELIAKIESSITTGVVGAAVWVGDDSMYQMMRTLSDQCVFIVPHFTHNYLDCKDFMSRNISALPAEYGKNVAVYMVEQLAKRGITSGTIGVTQASGNLTENAVNDAFRNELLRLGANFSVTETIYEGVEVSGAAAKITGIIQSHTNIVAGLGTTGGSAQAWALAMQNTGRHDLVVVAMDYTEINIDLVTNETITAIVAQPLYAEAQAAAESFDAIFNGKDYTVSEDEWFLAMDAPILYANGEGEHDVENYRPIIETVIDFFSNR